MPDVGGRRLPRLFRKIHFSLRVVVHLAFSLPVRRLREDLTDVEAWMFFLMLPCWCLTLPLCGGVAGHRVTRRWIGIWGVIGNRCIGSMSPGAIAVLIRLNAQSLRQGIPFLFDVHFTWVVVGSCHVLHELWCYCHWCLAIMRL